MPTGKLKPASASRTAAQIREAIGAGPNEEVTVTSPWFTRPAGEPVPGAAPKSRAAFTALKKLSKKKLKALGLRPWGRPDGDDRPTLWLFPGEWYSSIPRGLPVVDIFFKHKTFKPGTTDDDIRFGCLSFGVLRDE